MHRRGRRCADPEGTLLEAFRAIGHLVPSASGQWRLLASNLSVDNPFRRRYALYALRQMQAPIEILPALRRALQDEETDLRNRAAAIGAFGPQVASALPEVRSVESDPRTAPFVHCSRTKITGAWRDPGSPEGGWSDMDNLTTAPRLLPEIWKLGDSVTSIPIPAAVESRVPGTYQ